MPKRAARAFLHQLSMSFEGWAGEAAIAILKASGVSGGVDHPNYVLDCRSAGNIAEVQGSKPTCRFGH